MWKAQGCQAAAAAASPQRLFWELDGVFTDVHGLVLSACKCSLFNPADPRQTRGPTIIRDSIPHPSESSLQGSFARVMVVPSAAACSTVPLLSEVHRSCLWHYRIFENASMQSIIALVVSPQIFWCMGAQPDEPHLASVCNALLETCLTWGAIEKERLLDLLQEGELRPQLLDRFGLSVQVFTLPDIKQRVTLVLDRLLFEQVSRSPGFVPVRTH